MEGPRGGSERWVLPLLPSHLSSRVTIPLGWNTGVVTEPQLPGPKTEIHAYGKDCRVGE